MENLLLSFSTAEEKNQTVLIDSGFFGAFFLSFLRFLLFSVLTEKDAKISVPLCVGVMCIQHILQWHAKHPFAG